LPPFPCLESQYPPTLHFAFFPTELTFHQKVSAYDEDSTLSIDHLLSLPTCTGRIGTTGMCLGGHLAYRCALDPRVSAGVCYFATDIHSATLGAGGDDSLKRAKDIKGELVMVRSTLPSILSP
jgi:dienelactone hydrolase